MPVLKRGAAAISYQIRGSGHPLLLLAPGGMRSEARWWAHQPGTSDQRPRWINPLDELSDLFLVIGMDQRNAGSSTAPITAEDGWSNYIADQLALMDHLGLRRFHVMGGCIGCSFALGLCRAAPDRVTAAVLQNPIGLTEGNRPNFHLMFEDWAAEMKGSHPEFDDAAAAAFRGNMFDGDFVFTATREFVKACPIPMLVMPGGDDFHPRSVAEDIVSLAPGAELLDPWGGDQHRDNTLRQVREFLLAHAP